MDNTVETEFEAAIATARYALEQFNLEPTAAAQRGSARLSPWFRAWKEASEVAQRWHRQRTRPEPERSLDDEFDEILREAREDT